ncbi:MAG: NAD(+)/NADH kinase [Acidimicrobiia bacterium]|nr:NAD(+)/NADH kinase [Acidimicrobiia bacterium]
MKAVRHIGLVVHPDRAEATELAAHAVAWCSARDIETVVVEAGPLDDDPMAPFLEPLDAVLSFGGDGTMLRAVAAVTGLRIPVLGINCGQMGYLTEIEPSGLEEALIALQAGDYTVSERTMLSVEVASEGPAGGVWNALNEAVVEKPNPGRLVRLEVVVNGAAFTSYAADGVIVATPTGSTAYSFSAGGPIVSPRLACFLMTPVSPHMLFDRTLVLDDDEQLELEVMDRPALLTIDGRELGEIEAGTVVRCTCAPEPVRMITLVPRDFHQILKAKFGLADR